MVGENQHINEAGTAAEERRAAADGLAAQDGAAEGSAAVVEQCGAVAVDSQPVETQPVAAAAATETTEGHVHAAVAAGSQVANQYRATADEHVQTLKNFWKNFLVSGLFVVAAVVIILACLAWFMNNNRVGTTGVGVSAAGVRYAITAEGDRAGSYDSDASNKASGKLNTSDSMNVSVTSNLSNYDGSAKLVPGSHGSFTFTVTPYADDVHNITVNLNRCLVTRQGGVYPTANAESDATLEPLLKLLSGHIVFFENIDSNGFYEQPILNDALTIDESAFGGSNRISVTKTIYWVWPEHFRDFVLTGSANYEQYLFATPDAEGHSNLLKNINDNDSWNKYFRESERPMNAQGVITVEQGMPTADLQACSDAYDAADEEIGNNVQYIQIRLTANEAGAQ